MMSLGEKNGFGTALDATNGLAISAEYQTQAGRPLNTGSLKGVASLSKMNVIEIARIVTIKAGNSVATISKLRVGTPNLVQGVSKLITENVRVSEKLMGRPVDAGCPKSMPMPEMMCLGETNGFGTSQDATNGLATSAEYDTQAGRPVHWFP